MKVEQRTLNMRSIEGLDSIRHAKRCKMTLAFNEVKSVALRVSIHTHIKLLSMYHK